ncbi:MAG: hypothetical protein PUC47_05560 [Oscillospiraceae bacterium]|nr:hypothetical protein [Oscillospiraceae bacterium]
MTLLEASLLLVVMVIGIILVCRFLRKNRALRITCIVVLSLIALVLAGYIGLTLIFVYAVSHH